MLVPKTRVVIPLITGGTLHTCISVENCPLLESLILPCSGQGDTDVSYLSMSPQMHRLITAGHGAGALAMLVIMSIPWYVVSSTVLGGDIQSSSFSLLFFHSKTRLLWVCIYFVIVPMTAGEKYPLISKEPMG